MSWAIVAAGGGLGMWAVAQQPPPPIVGWAVEELQPPEEPSKDVILQGEGNGDPK